MSEKSEGSGFTFSTVGMEEEKAVQHIAELREQDIHSPTDFILRGNFSPNLTEQLCQTFEHFASNDIKWNKLCVYVNYYLDVNFHRLGDAIGIANRASLFANMNVEVLYYTQEQELRTDLRILRHLESNHRLETIVLREFCLSQEDMISLSRTIRRCKTLVAIDLDCYIPDCQSLCKALAFNVSLRKVRIHDNGHGTSPILRSLIGHPSLANLVVCEKIDVEGFLVALSEVLSSTSCHITELSIGYHIPIDLEALLAGRPYKTPINVAPLLEGLGKNASLKSLESGFGLPGDQTLSKLLRIWKKHPKLERIEVNEQFSLEDIQNANGGGRFQRRVEFVCGELQPPQTNRHQVAIKNILDTNPELCWTHDLRLENACYSNCMNHAGRYLLTRDVPLGLWPLVLARIRNRSLPSSHFGSNHLVSTVYEFLHGQTFAGRSSIAATKLGKKRKRDVVDS